MLFRSPLYVSGLQILSVSNNHICCCLQDGSHIKGLLINFIHHNWPDLLKLPFLEEFITPIVKATKGTNVSFYFNKLFFSNNVTLFWSFITSSHLISNSMYNPLCPLTPRQIPSPPLFILTNILKLCYTILEFYDPLPPFDNWTIRPLSRASWLFRSPLYR